MINFWWKHLKTWLVIQPKDSEWGPESMCAAFAITKPILWVCADPEVVTVCK